MKLLFLCKRRPQGRDLLTQPYGRFYHLPLGLAERGHEVTVAILDYRRSVSWSGQDQGIRWIRESLLPWGPATYWSRLQALAHEWRPDWIIGCSDTYYGIMATRLAAQVAARSLVDAYDNYESYLPRMWPLHRSWRSAIHAATAITVAGPALGVLMAAHREQQDYVVVPMAADPGFVPMPRKACRQRLGLNENKQYVGYCGALSGRRDLATLRQVIAGFAGHSQIELLLSGRKDRGMVLPKTCRWLGCLDAAQMPVLLNALDVLLVLNRPSSFGNYSYPVKLYEAMACQRPAVVSDLPATRWILRQHPQLLCSPGDAAAVRKQVLELLATDAWDYRVPSGWGNSVALFEQVLHSS